MKKLLSFIVFSFIGFCTIADEGMWIPSLVKQLNINDMQALGFKLTAEEIYDINKSSLKDAVVHFNGGCTGEMVSNEGLLITNHHCGYGQVQFHSSVKNDYLKNGFWAMNHDEELPNPGLSVSFIVRIDDVTEQVNENIKPDIDVRSRNSQVRDNIKKIVEKATKGNHYEAEVKPVFGGNEYYLYVKETFKDVRLVGAPPDAIGKFGGDSDNWMWPRHTGDFAVFRVYANANNKPADYSRSNVPYKPKHFFPISLKGVQQNDFTMVYGFPGRTTEYLPSPAVEYIINVGDPAKIKMRESILSIIETDMKLNDELRIKYAAKHARIANYYKKWQGEVKGLKRLNAVEKKKEFEAEFMKRVATKPEWQKTYGNVMGDYTKYYKEIEKLSLAKDYFGEISTASSELMKFIFQFRGIVNELSSFNVKADNINEGIQKLKESYPLFFKDLNISTDKKLFVTSMNYYKQDIDPSMHPAVFMTVDSKYKGDFKKYADFIYSKTVFLNQDYIKTLLSGNFDASAAKKLKADPGFQLMESFYTNYYVGVKVNYDKINDLIEANDRLYMKGIKEIMPEKKMYPDANGTMRISYGKVEGYFPMDGVEYEYYTTLEGILEKENPNNEEFIVPAKLKELIAKKDYGQYEFDGTIPVCFTASNHTTGGNSGSPVLNADGHLIGVNFDRSWESTMSDVMFDPERCRNIVLDMRYVLFIIDKYAGASYLLKEMDIITVESEMRKKIEKLNADITASPTSHELYNERGRSLFAVKDYKGALTNFAKASQLSPSTAKYYYNQGSVMVLDQLFEEAIAMFSKAISTDSKYTEAYYNRGKTYAELNKLTEAIQDFTVAIELDPNHSKSYNNRGVAKNIMTETKDGCEDIRKAMELGSKRAHKTYFNWCE